MSNHAKHIATMKNRMELLEIKKGKNFEKIFNNVGEGVNGMTKTYEYQQAILNLCLHSSDISNPAKPRKISEMWTNRIYDEFFKQGDREFKEGLPISLLCDRNTTNVNEAMLGFMNFVVLPTFDIIVNLFPELNNYYDYLIVNIEKTEEQIKKEESELK